MIMIPTRLTAAVPEVLTRIGWRPIRDPLIAAIVRTWPEAVVWMEVRA